MIETLDATGSSRSARSLRYHDSLAAGWDHRYARGGFQRRAAFFRREVLPTLACAGRWIDVGCGGGYFSRVLAERGAVVLGVDGSPGMIAAARAAAGNAREAPPRFEVQAVEALGRRNDRFDGVLCLSVLEYVDDPAAALADMAAILQPGGYLVLSAPNRYSLLRSAQVICRRLAGLLAWEAFSYLGRSTWSWSRDELVSMVEFRGLSVAGILGFDPVLPKPILALAPASLWFVVCRKGGSDDGMSGAEESFTSLA